MSEFICHEDKRGAIHLNIPTEEIIRCRDCKNWKDAYCLRYLYLADGPILADNKWLFPVYEDDYCSFATRRVNND